MRLKTRQFWMIFTTWLLYGFFYQVGAVHIVPYATDRGMSALAAATLLTIIGLVGLSAEPAWDLPVINSVIRATLAVSFILMAVAFLAIAVSTKCPHALCLCRHLRLFFGSGYFVGIN